MCDSISPGEMQHTGLLTPDREPTTDQSSESTKSNLVNQLVLLGSLTEIWMRSCLQAQKWLKDSYITEVYPSMGGSIGNLERTPQPEHSLTHWSLFQVTQLVLTVTLPGSWAHLRVFVAAQLSSIGDGLSLLFRVAGWGWANLVSFRDFLKPFWVVCLPSCISNFPVGWNVTILEESVL